MREDSSLSSGYTIVEENVDLLKENLALLNVIGDKR
jgi:hypothetical protein